MRTTLSIITHAVQVVTVLFCILYVLNKKSFQLYRFFSIGWVIILLHDLAMVIIGLINPANNLWVYNIAFPLQQLFYMLFFILLLQKRTWMIVMIVYALFAILNLWQWQGLVKLNTMSLALGGIIIVLLAFIELYKLYKQDTAQSLFHDPGFWISAGFILYWGFASPFFAMYNFLWEAYPGFFIVYFYTVNFGFLVLLNLSIIKALQCSLKTRKSSFS